MKKMTNKLIAIVLAMTLVLSMSGVAFAAVDGAAVNPETAVTMEGTAAAKTKTVDGQAKVKLMSEEEVDALSIKTMTKALDAEPAYDKWDLGAYEYGLATVTATTTGWIWFDYIVTGADTDGVNVYLCDSFNETTGEFTYYENASGGLYAGQTYENAAGIYAKKGDTYYVYMETPASNSDNVVVKARAKMYSSMYRDLPVYTNTKQYMISSGYNKAGTGTSDLYYKVVPNKTGLMTVNLKCFTDYHTTGTVTLYNYNKKVKLSNAVQYSSASASTKAYFGVTKGKTYYLRVQNVGDTSGYYYPCYGIKYGMTAYTDRYLPTNSKAKALTKGTKVRTLFTANNATGTDTYKIYNPKKQTVKFTVNTQNMRSGNVTVKVYRNGKQVGATKTIYPNKISSPYTITYGTTSGKANAGTYYIKLIKGAKASGQYSIVWNK